MAATAGWRAPAATGRRGAAIPAGRYRVHAQPVAARSAASPPRGSPGAGRPGAAAPAGPRRRPGRPRSSAPGVRSRLARTAATWAATYWLELSGTSSRMATAPARSPLGEQHPGQPERRADEAVVDPPHPQVAPGRAVPVAGQLAGGGERELRRRLAGQRLVDRVEGEDRAWRGSPAASATRPAYQSAPPVAVAAGSVAQVARRPPRDRRVSISARTRRRVTSTRARRRRPQRRDRAGRVGPPSVARKPAAGSVGSTSGSGSAMRRPSGRPAVSAAPTGAEGPPLRR